MRSKEDAKDYRYFPDPDLPPIHISDAWIEELRASIPELREAKMERYQKEYELPAYDAGILTESRHLAGLFEDIASVVHDGTVVILSGIIDFKADYVKEMYGKLFTVVDERAKGEWRALKLVLRRH